MNKNKVLVGMSGGVDSSVSAFILKKEGYEVHGLFMKNWDDDDGSPYCSIKEDFMDAAFVADQLEIPLFEVNFAKEYKEKYGVDGIMIGRAAIGNPWIFNQIKMLFTTYGDDGGLFIFIGKKNV